MKKKQRITGEYMETLKNENFGNGKKEDIKEFGFYWLYQGVIFFNN